MSDHYNGAKKRGSGGIELVTSITGVPCITWIAALQGCSVVTQKVPDWAQFSNLLARTTFVGMLPSRLFFSQTYDIFQFLLKLQSCFNFNFLIFPSTSWHPDNVILREFMIKTSSPKFSG